MSPRPGTLPDHLSSKRFRNRGRIQTHLLHSRQLDEIRSKENSQRQEDKNSVGPLEAVQPGATSGLLGSSSAAAAGDDRKIAPQWRIP